MSRRNRWDELRQDKLASPAASVGYERARRAFELALLHCRRARAGRSRNLVLGSDHQGQLVERGRDPPASPAPPPPVRNGHAAGSARSYARR
jgi:hypothetical protein